MDGGTAMPRSTSAKAARAVRGPLIARRDFTVALGLGLYLPMLARQQVTVGPAASTRMVWGLHHDQPCLMPSDTGQEHTPPSGWRTLDGAALSEC